MRPDPSAGGESIGDPLAHGLLRLRELLVDVDTPPLAHAEAIRAQRAVVAREPALAAELDALELRFLERQAARRDTGPELAAAVAVPRRLALECALRRALQEPADSAAALFDLAELQAAFLREDRAAAAASAGAAIDARALAVTLGERLAQETRERYAALVTGEEDLDLREKVLLLEKTVGIVDALARRSEATEARGPGDADQGSEMADVGQQGQRRKRRREGDARFYRSIARRLWNAANDRRLALRIESLLTHRGAVWLETTSFVLLLIVLVLLTIEAAVTLAPATQMTFLLVDGAICSFFVAEFVFKLTLAPARRSWFLRNALTDLLPAIPAALCLFAPLDGGAGLAGARAVRLVRVVTIARYVQMMRPLLGLFRLLLFLIRGLDSLVQRFSPLVNRNFVFFEPGAPVDAAVEREGARRLVFQALRREHVLLDDLPTDLARPALLARAGDLALRLGTEEVPVRAVAAPPPTVEARDIPVEEAIERLYSLRPEELSMTMARHDLMAIDRVSRVINAPLIQSLPFVRWFRSRDPGNTPEQRVVSLGRRIADNLERWQNRALLLADLHGIVTGPQILDRIATAMVKASQRPAVRLLIFGLLFSLVRMILPEDSALSTFLKRFVATPLVVLGGVCLVILLGGRWLKRLAGEAAENLKRTSEAHFINLLELVKAKTRDEDLLFLARRVFRFEMDSWEAALALGRQVSDASSGRLSALEEAQATKDPPPAIREDLSRVAFLYLHFLDGAILHESDSKTTEQLLANLSLENIRKHHLRYSRRDETRVRRLSLSSGSLTKGPYLWFRFITESVALETAKRIIEYNRHCLSQQQRRVSPPDEVAAMERWIAKRRDHLAGRIVERIEPPDAGDAGYRTTEFNSMDFLAVNPQRDAQIGRIFGAEVLDLLREDRRCMIREIFGARPLHRLPRSQRSVNFYRFYLQRLSRGRVLLAPFFFLGALWWLLRSVVKKIVVIVREITRPESISESRESGRAPFSVALRKIHRMKAPGLLEAMQMRASFDPVYCGAPPTWSFGVVLEEVPELELDMDFLQMRERDRLVMRDIATTNRRRVEQLHTSVRTTDLGIDTPDPTQRQLGERSVTIAYLTDREHLRSLFGAERWLERELPRFEDPALRLPAQRLGAFVYAIRRRFARHPVDRLLDTALANRRISRRGRRSFRRAWLADEGDVRAIVAAWSALPRGVAPTTRALELARGFFLSSGEVSRELVALRAIQSLSVLDVRNYRDLVFQLGGYASDGEDPTLATALP